MTELRCEMNKFMQLRDLSENTQKSYLRAVSGLARHYKMTPDKISKSMVEDYLLYLKKRQKTSLQRCRDSGQWLKILLPVCS